jgi:alkaline phosphatase
MILKMKKNCLSVFLLVCFSFFYVKAQEIKNIVVMIPDGASVNLLSIARWYQQYQNPERNFLHLDTYLCGMIRTHSSDSPIGDSAPTTSCYMTGQPTQTGFVSMYPPKTTHDLVMVDSTMTYQPMTTLLEAMKYLQSKSTGLVFTCEFPHATPADCSAHWYKRNNYDVIGKQMIYQNLDVVFGGGNKFLTKDYKNHLKQNQYAVFQDDLLGFRNNENSKVWALFNEEAMPYEIDRNKTTTPSLAEMTRKALLLLSSNPKGFFLMVEGSKVDWAAHDNDGITMIRELLAFDEAVGAAVDFAKRDGHTLVVVVPDHGNSGISLGNRNSNWGYDKLTLDTIIRPLLKYSISSSSFTKILKKAKVSQIKDLFQTYYAVNISNEEVNMIEHCQEFENSPYSKEERKNYLLYTINKILYDNHSYLGFSSYGHTGEDVFLAIYHPNNEIFTGIHTNVQLHEYLRKQAGFADPLTEINQQLFIPHQMIFQDYKNIKIDSIAPNQYVLKAKKGKKRFEIESYTDFVTLNSIQIPLKSVNVYVDKKKTFYLPQEIRQLK